MKYDYSKLRGKIKEIFGTQEKFAEKIKMSKTSLSNKLNNITDFSQNEIDISAKELGLLDIEIGDYFFNKKVE